MSVLLRSNGFTKNCYLWTTAAAVVGTGGVVGGGKIIDQQTGGPERRMQAEATEGQD